MKIWYGYGSEHSMNLVMIGRFQDVGDAEKAKQVIEWLTAQVEADVQAGRVKVGDQTDRFPTGMLDLLSQLNINTIGATELEQFTYDVNVRVEDNQIIMTTNEIDVSAFLKVLIEKGARVEIYSAHNYSDTKYGRGK